MNRASNGEYNDLMDEINDGIEHYKSECHNPHLYKIKIYMCDSYLNGMYDLYIGHDCGQKCERIKVTIFKKDFPDVIGSMSECYANIEITGIGSRYT